MRPPGFHLIVLPFMDDIRYPERDPKVTGEKFYYANEEQTCAAAAVIDALTLPEDFSTVDISNPHLQRHYQVLEVFELLNQATFKNLCFRPLHCKMRFQMLLPLSMNRPQTWTRYKFTKKSSWPSKSPSTAMP